MYKEYIRKGKLTKMCFQGSKGTLSVFPNYRKTRRPCRLIGHFYLILFVVNSHKRRTFRRKFVHRTSRTRLVQGTRQANFRPKGSKGSLITPYNCRNKRVQVFFGHFNRMFGRREHFGQNKGRSKVPSLFHGTRGAFLRRLITLRQVEERTRTCHSIPLIPGILHHVVHNNHPITIRVKGITTLMKNTTRGTKSTIHLRPRLNLLQKAIGCPTSTFKFNGGLNGPLIQIVTWSPKDFGSASTSTIFLRGFKSNVCLHRCTLDRPFRKLKHRGSRGFFFFLGQVTRSVFGHFFFHDFRSTPQGLST